MLADEEAACFGSGCRRERRLRREFQVDQSVVRLEVATSQLVLYVCHSRQGRFLSSRSKARYHDRKRCQLLFDVVL